MKISNWSLAGMIAGLIFAVGSFIRYWIYYPDLDRVIVYVIMGILIFAVSFLYNRLIWLGHTLEGVEEYLANKNLNKEV